MKEISRWILFILMVVITISCTDPVHINRMQTINDWMKNNNKVKVLCTTEMIGDIVKAVGGNHINLITLISGNLGPHNYEIVKGDDEKIRNADIVFFNGLGLESTPSLNHLLKSQKKSISIGKWIMKNYPHDVYIIKGQVDPHIWLDISIWQKIITPIVDALIEVDPEHSNEFKANGKKTLNHMEKTHYEIKMYLQEIPEEKRYIITSHNSLNYFTRAYLSTNEELKNGNWKNRYNSPEGLMPNVHMNLVDIQRIIDFITKYNIKTLFAEANVSTDSLKKIIDAAKKKKIYVHLSEEPLYCDTLGESTENNYIKMMQHNAYVIEKYLNN